MRIATSAPGYWWKKRQFISGTNLGVKVSNFLIHSTEHSAIDEGLPLL
nr:hypothetical protein [Marinobacter persicus]